MIEQQGQVVSVTQGRATIRLGGTAGCAACDAGKGCGAGIFGRLLRRKPVDMELPDDLGCRTGEPVVVGLPERLLLRLVFRFYLFPLLAGLAGAALGHYLAIRGGLQGASVDIGALVGAVLAGGTVLVVNRTRASEFPPENAVHLLRRGERSIVPPGDRDFYNQA